MNFGGTGSQGEGTGGDKKEGKGTGSGVEGGGSAIR